MPAQLCITTPSPYGDYQIVTIEQRVETNVCRTRESKEGSSEYPLSMEKASTDRDGWKDKLLDSTMVVCINEWLAVSSFLQKTTYRVLIFMKDTASTHHTIHSLLSLVVARTSSTVPLSPLAAVKPVRAPGLNDLIIPILSKQAITSIQTGIGELQARPWLDIVENLAVNELCGMCFYWKLYL